MVEDAAIRREGFIDSKRLKVLNRASIGPNEGNRAAIFASNGGLEEITSIAQDVICPFFRRRQIKFCREFFPRDQSSISNDVFEATNSFVGPFFG